MLRGYFTKGAFSYTTPLKSFTASIIFLCFKYNK